MTHRKIMSAFAQSASVPLQQSVPQLRILSGFSSKWIRPDARLKTFSLMMFDSEPASAVYNAASEIEMLGSEDLAGGVAFGIALAFLGSRNPIVGSFLQGQTPLSSSSDLLLLNDIKESVDHPGGMHVPSSSQNITNTADGVPPSERTGDEDKIFGAESWKEMSKQENFVYYNTRVRKNLRQPLMSLSDKKSAEETKSEKKWVIFGLLIFFIPIFSFELFLALSRQFMCNGDPFMQVEWAREFCSPYRPPQF